MAAILHLLGASSPKITLPRIESDDVYPVHMLDDIKTFRDLAVTWTLRFNDVLDADKLHTSLSKLLEIDDWRKVGGRLRLNENGRLEIHTPRPFTAQRPAVSYSHQLEDMNIDDHALANTLPKATDTASIQSGPGAFRAFAARENAPETLQDYINHDEPQLALRIISFNNATLVSLSWLHTLMDVMGQQALLLGWSLVLAGRESEVPPLLGARVDAICAATDVPAGEEAEKYHLGQIRLKGWDMLVFGARFAWDMIWNQVIETRTIFLPSGVVAELRRQAQSDLTEENNDKEKPFISEGDVLTAWAIRAVASSLPTPRPVTALHALNARFRLPSLVADSGLYVQNMSVAAFAMLTPEVATGPLGPIALENRRCLAEQATEGQVLAGLREIREEAKTGTESVLMCGEPNALLMPFTNWTRANFFKTIDFNPALVRTGDVSSSRRNPPGTMVYHHAVSMKPSPTMRNVVVVLGKDYGDNYWLTATLLPAAWAKLEEEVKKM